jgi:hypothetical protein
MYITIFKLKLSNKFIFTDRSVTCKILIYISFLFSLFAAELISTFFLINLELNL